MSGVGRLGGEVQFCTYLMANTLVVSWWSFASPACYRIKYCITYKTVFLYLMILISLIRFQMEGVAPYVGQGFTSLDIVMFFFFVNFSVRMVIRLDGDKQGCVQKCSVGSTRLLDDPDRWVSR